MCGLVAVIGMNGWQFNTGLISRMNRLHNLRGPDYALEVILENRRIALAHSRLSIIDLSSEANQPMATADKNHWIVFNGEVYNFVELRNKLIGHGVSFRSQSDTEVVLKSLRHWGSDTVGMLEGIFAFVYIDLSKKIILAARDRIGVKPLCFFQSKDVIGFSSTVKPLQLLDEFNFEIDEIARFEMLTSKFTCAPRSIFKQIRKVMPGTYMEVDFSGKVKTSKFWSVGDWIDNDVDKTVGEKRTFENRHLNTIRGAISNAVKRQLVADVPVGVFLSGGTDSSLITAICNSHRKKIKSFTIGFDVQRYDESEKAKQIANYLGTEHHEKILSAADIINALMGISDAYDEPFGDASAIPTFILSKFARQHVTVALSGDGGDELFFGYPRYHLASQLINAKITMPDWLKKIGKSVSAILPGTRFLNHLANTFFMPLDGTFYPQYVYGAYARMCESVGGGDASLIKKSGLFRRSRLGYEIARNGENPLRHSMMYADLLNYLPDDCLTKVDRASMASSLEVRVPLLDEQVVKAGLRTPLSLKWKNREGKYILKKLLCEYIPKELVYLPKQGFGVPLDVWLFNELGPYAEDLLSTNNLLSAGLNPEGVSKIIKDHINKKGDFQYFLWPLCSYIAWFLRKDQNVHSEVSKKART